MVTNALASSSYIT